MRSSSRSGGRASLFLGIVGLGLFACSLDSELPNREQPNVASASSGAVLSGAGAPDGDSWGSGEAPSITDILDAQGGTPNAGPSQGGGEGGIDGSATSNGGVEAQGGTVSASGRGGAAAGGTNGKAGASGKAGSGGSGGAPNPTTTLFISEYVEGSSANKAIEISSGKRSSLDGCKLGTYFNGKSEATVVATLSGVLEAGKVLTVCTSTLAAKLGAVCQQVGNLTFNGNDAVAISCDGRILDVIGQAGVDPGAAWGSAPLSTLDHTLRRKCTITAGDTNEQDAFDPSREWQAFPVDAFDGLGSRGCP